MPQPPAQHPFAHLLQQLEQVQPRQLLFLGNHLPDFLTPWANDSNCELTTLDSQHRDWQQLTRFDFAIVADYLEHLPKAEGLQRLARLRNLHSPRIWVLVDQGSTWEFADFISLGFCRCGSVASDASCYGYDLATYNHRRDWNNPRFWANPENWNKYRW